MPCCHRAPLLFTRGKTKRALLLVVESVVVLEERETYLAAKEIQYNKKTMPSSSYSSSDEQQHVSLTIAEREAELAALQSAFDEYITSSRELEEELDAELGKMRTSCRF